MNKIQLRLYVENHCKKCEYYNIGKFKHHYNPVCVSRKNLFASGQADFMYLDHIPQYRPRDPYPQELCYERDTNIS
jgi:hypothetical protein